MLIRHASHYLSSSIVSAALGLLSVVVFTRALSDAEYGIYVIGTSTAGVISAILFAWIRLSVLRFQSEGKSVDVRATALFAYAFAAAASPIFLCTAALFTNASTTRMLATALFTLGLGLFDITQEILKAQQKTRVFMTGAILRASSAFLLCLASVAFGFGGVGQLAAAGAAYFLTSAILSRSICSGPLAPLDTTQLQRFMRYGVPIALSGLVYSFHAALDRLIVAGVLGEAAAGQYGAAADLVRQIILVPATSVASAALPLAVAAFAQGGIAKARPHLEHSAELLFAVLLPATVGLALVSGDVANLILGPDFRATAAAIMRILCFAWLFQAISQSFVHTSFHLAQRPILLACHGAATLAVNVVATFLLVSRFAFVGAALALVLSEACGVLLGLVLTRFACPLPLVPAKLLRIAVSTAVMAVLLGFVGSRLPVSGAGAVAIKTFAGILIYAMFVLVFDIAGMRRSVQNLLIGMRRRYLVQST
ncbi:MAG: polysaccharide biosynthesis C-terminal domain-containing protein [Methylobacteriaceae bacterium]|nr:polysaccharide biosynthesis C-terminal domain-containing protein [Methylobacteriaceae bacterium]